MTHGHRANSYDITITWSALRDGEQSAAAVLVGIRHSTNSVGLPTTAFSGFIYYLHRAVRRLSGTAMYRTHFPKPLPWRGRAVDRSTTVHIAQWQAHSSWALQCIRRHRNLPYKAQLGVLML